MILVARLRVFRGIKLASLFREDLFKLPSPFRVQGFSQPVRGMKRKASSSPEPTARKEAKFGDYCYEQPICKADGDPIWPVPESQLATARDFLKEW
jgi:hypothetical protein